MGRRGSLRRATGSQATRELLVEAPFEFGFSLLVISDHMLGMARGSCKKQALFPGLSANIRYGQFSSSSNRRNVSVFCYGLRNYLGRHLGRATPDDGWLPYWPELPDS